MDEALALLQEAMQALDEAIRATPNPEHVNTLTTCLSQMAAVQQKMMQPEQAGGARQALVGQLGGGVPGGAY
jgi:hypothetical protein